MDVRGTTTHAREGLNKHWIIGIVAALALIVGSVFVLASWRKAERTPPAAPLRQVFYTTDDGKTWFADDSRKVYPFDRNGQQAYRAYVFKCGPNGKPFTAYVEQLDEATRAKVAELNAQATTRPAQEQIDGVIQNGRLVKRPGEGEWVDAQSEAGDAVTSPTCPDGEDIET